MSIVNIIKVETTGMDPHLEDSLKIWAEKKMEDKIAVSEKKLER